MVELGWVGLLVPEAQGGAGMGLLEMMVVLEEMGRLPLPGPFLSSAVLATLAAPGPRPRRPAGVAGHGRDPGHGGHRRGGPRRRGRPDPHRGRGARRGSGGCAGIKSVVLDGHTRRLGAGAGPHPAGDRHLPDRGAPGRARTRALDVTRRLARLELDDVPADAGRSRRRPHRRSGSGSSTTRRWRCAPRRWARCSRPSTWPSSTPRCACSSIVRSPRSRPSSTRRPRCSSASSCRGSASTTRRGPPTPTSRSGPRRRPWPRPSWAGGQRGVRRGHPDPRRRRLHLGVRRPPALPQGQGQRPAARLPGTWRQKVADSYLGEVSCALPVGRSSRSGAVR